MTPIDLLMGLKTEELRKNEIDFDFQNFKECVWGAKARGMELNAYEV